MFPKPDFMSAAIFLSMFGKLRDSLTEIENWFNDLTLAEKKKSPLSQRQAHYDDLWIYDAFILRDVEV